jgi:hypothetical protein
LGNVSIGRLFVGGAGPSAACDPEEMINELRAAMPRRHGSLAEGPLRALGTMEGPLQPSRSCGTSIRYPLPYALAYSTRPSRIDMEIKVAA